MVGRLISFWEGPFSEAVSFRECNFLLAKYLPEKIQKLPTWSYKNRWQFFQNLCFKIHMLYIGVKITSLRKIVPDGGSSSVSYNAPFRMSWAPRLWCRWCNQLEKKNVKKSKGDDALPTSIHTGLLDTVNDDWILPSILVYLLSIQFIESLLVIFGGIPPSSIHLPGVYWKFMKVYWWDWILLMISPFVCSNDTWLSSPDFAYQQWKRLNFRDLKAVTCKGGEN